MALTLPPELREVLFDLAEASGRPAAAIVVELLTEMTPQLKGMAKMIRSARAGKVEAAKRALRHMVGDALAEVMTTAQPDLFKVSGKKPREKAKAKGE